MTKTHFLDRAETVDGYPFMDFEDWYQHGVECYYAQLPKTLRKQAMIALATRWAAQGRNVPFWGLRAFAYGATGRYSNGKHAQRVLSDYRWPTPPDAAWKVVVCCYPDGTCELDMVHPVSRRFWSEDNGFFESPGEKGDRYFTRTWYERMGFDVIFFHPDAVAMVGEPTPHLCVI